MLLDFYIPRIVAFDSKDIYTSLLTEPNSVDQSICDVNCILFDFENQAISRMVCIPDKSDLASPGTQPDIPLTPALQLVLSTGKIPQPVTSQLWHTATCPYANNDQGQLANVLHGLIISAPPPQCHHYHALSCE